MYRATTALRKLVNARKFLELPTRYDALTGRLIESLGFKSLYVGGFVTGGSTAISEPQLTMSEQIRVASDVANGLKIPVVMDAGAGWGEPLHTMRTIRECIRAGIAGVHIEDQLFSQARALPHLRRAQHSDQRVPRQDQTRVRAARRNRQGLCDHCALRRVPSSRATTKR
jgi:2-methylisocitrate lyase-like PEP mutase family enzyme